MKLCRLIYIDFCFSTILFSVVVQLSDAITENRFLNMSDSYFLMESSEHEFFGAYDHSTASPVFL